MNNGDAEGRVEILDAAKPGSGRKSRGGGGGASRVTTKRGHSHPETVQLMEAVVERENMKAAWLRVKGNKGAAGVDGMSVDALLPYLREGWPSIKEDLLAGRYQPSPVRKVEIPKPGGGMRQLGIPAVLDRFIQQAVLQVLQRSWDQTFSEQSYGFRFGSSAHQAVAQAQTRMPSGVTGKAREGLPMSINRKLRSWNVKVFLESFTLLFSFAFVLPLSLSP